MKIIFNIQRFVGINVNNTASNTIISGTGYNDTIINSGSNVKIAGKINDDYIESNNASKVSISGGHGNDTIITGANNWLNQGKNITVLGGTGNDLIDLHPSTENYNVIKYASGDGNDIIYGFGEDDTLQISANNFSTLKGSNSIYIIFENGDYITLSNYIGEITGANFIKIGGDSTNKWTISNGTAKYGTSSKTLIKITGLSSSAVESDITLKNKVVTVNSSAVANNTKVSVTGSGYKFNLNGSSGKNTLIGGSSDDTLTGGNGADLFVYTGGNDVITDYVAGIDKISIKGSSSYEISGNNVIFTVGTGSLTVKNGANKKITVNGKTQTYSDDTEDLTEGLSYDDSGIGLLADNNFTDTKIDLSDYGNIVNISAKNFSQAIHLVGDNRNNSLVGGKGDDTLQGNSGADTLTGGDGKDMFIHYEGNDVITDYKPGTDIIYLDETDIIGAKIKFNDVILSTNNGSITVQNGKNKNITIVDSEGNETTKTYGVLPSGLSYSNNNTIITANKNFSGDTINLADYADTVKKVDTSRVANDIEIVGNKLANNLIGGKGSDILSGGTGNDTLTGNGGDDIFVHYTGADVITDYTATDKISLDNTKITKTKISGKDKIFTTSTGSITVKNGANKNITVIDSDGDEKIYSANVSANISEIVENNFVGEFEFENKITPQENLITFAK